MMVGQRTVIALNGGAMSLRIARHAHTPEKVFVYMHDCGVEDAASMVPPKPIAQGWMPAKEAPTLIRALSKAVGARDR